MKTSLGRRNKRNCGEDKGNNSNQIIFGLPHAHLPDFFPTASIIVCLTFDKTMARAQYVMKMRELQRVYSTRDTNFALLRKTESDIVARVQAKTSCTLFQRRGLFICYA